MIYFFLFTLKKQFDINLINRMSSLISTTSSLLECYDENVGTTKNCKDRLAPSKGLEWLTKKQMDEYGLIYSCPFSAKKTPVHANAGCPYVFNQHTPESHALIGSYVENVHFNNNTSFNINIGLYRYILPGRIYDPKQGKLKLEHLWVIAKDIKYKHDNNPAFLWVYYTRSPDTISLFNNANSSAITPNCLKRKLKRANETQFNRILVTYTYNNQIIGPVILPFKNELSFLTNNKRKNNQVEEIKKKLKNKHRKHIKKRGPAVYHSTNTRKRSRDQSHGMNDDTNDKTLADYKLKKSLLRDYHKLKIHTSVYMSQLDNLRYLNVPLAQYEIFDNNKLYSSIKKAKISYGFLDDSIKELAMTLKDIK